MKPKIGVLMATQTDHPAMFTGNMVPKIVQNETYIRSVERNGGIPILIPPSEPDIMDSLMELCQGFLLPGGEDVDPSYYQEPILQRCGRIRPELDRSYQKVCDHAKMTGKPVFGICKGMQFLNVYHGGSLYQDLSYRAEESYKHQQEYDRKEPTHTVLIEADSHLCHILGQQEIQTNTMHHQVVKRLGDELRITAITSDGVTEAIETEDGREIGVQWHPEELLDNVQPMNRLFQNLVTTAAKVQLFQ